MNYIYRFMLSIIVFFSFSVFEVNAYDMPFKDLSPADLAVLQKGEPLNRIIDSYKEIRLESVDEESRKLLKLMKKVKPNFLSEILMVIPVQPGQNSLELIRDTLMDIENFDNIKTYSIRREKEFPLFEDTEILSVNPPAGGVSSIEASHTMRPFRPHESMYEYSLEGNTFLFTSSNSTPVYYNMFRAVKKGNMINVLWIKEEEGTLLVYGAGGASVSPFFTFFGDRLDDSFTGRVQAFFSWFYEKSISNLMIN